MPTVICRKCGRPWMDWKYAACPYCGTAGEAQHSSPAVEPPRTLAAARGRDQRAAARGPAATLDLTRATAQQIGSALDAAGVTWNYDDDGDVRVRFRSSQQPWVDAVFFDFDTAKLDFSMRGQFLNGRAVPQGNGMVRWEVPLDSGHQPTAVAQKVVTVYFIPEPGHVLVQIYASVAPVDRPMHIRIIPGSQQVSRIEREYPGFAGREGNKQFWMSAAATGTDVDEMSFAHMVRSTAQIGLAMFDGPFTGWLYATDL